MIRHGDIMLRPVGAAPAGLLDNPASPPISGDVCVLAEGEATGHSHVLHGSTIITPMRGRVYVHVVDGAELRHQEHSTIVVPPGWYEVIRQRVYTPVGPRPVRD